MNRDVSRATICFQDRVDSVSVVRIKKYLKPQYLNAHQDYEDGRPTFDVKFYVGMTEYHYEIDAATGQIFDADVDMEDYDMDFFDD